MKFTTSINKKIYQLPLFFITVLSIVTASTAEPLWAESKQEAEALFQLLPLHSKTGAVVSYGYCPCVRINLAFDVGGIQYENKTILISTDALLKVNTKITPLDARLTGQEFTIGAIQALVKGAHIGIGFSGITLGEDLDQSYSDILRTGLFFIVNLIRSDANNMRLDIDSGYDFEQLRVNGNPDLFSHHQLTEKIALHIHSIDQNSPQKIKRGRWSADLEASLSLSNKGAHKYRVSATGTVQAYRSKQLSFGVGLASFFEHSKLREEFGLEPNIVGANIFLDVSYLPF